MRIFSFLKRKTAMLEENLIYINKEVITLLDHEIEIIKKLRGIEKLAERYDLSNFESKEIGALQSFITELTENHNEIAITMRKGYKQIDKYKVRLERDITKLERKLSKLERIHLIFEQKLGGKKSNLFEPLNNFIKDIKKTINSFEELKTKLKKSGKIKFITTGKGRVCARCGAPIRREDTDGADISPAEGGKGYYTCRRCGFSGSLLFIRK